MLGSAYSEGLLVVHPSRPEWGPGKVLLVDGTKLKVYFRDKSGATPAEAVLTIDTRYVPLAKADLHSDPFLDNLPPYAEGEFQRKVKGRVTLEEGIELFHKHYPLDFNDPAYIGDLKTGERTYKWSAHELFLEKLGEGQAQRLLGTEDLDELRRRAMTVEGKTNLLSVFEKVAFRDGLKDDEAARDYFTGLIALLSAPEILQSDFERYIAGVDRLPADEGKHSPAKWTVATILPFLADPTRFMFLKPAVTQGCADRLLFDLNYKTDLNWLTYRKLLEMAGLLLERLRPYGARDYLDVQSFIWLIGAGWQDE